MVLAGSAVVLRGAELRISPPNRSECDSTLIGQVAVVDFRCITSYEEAAKEPLACRQILLAVIQALDASQSEPTVSLADGQALSNSLGTGEAQFSRSPVL